MWTPNPAAVPTGNNEVGIFVKSIG